MDGGKFDLENFPTSESAKRMLGYVTDGFYDKSYVGKWLFQVMGSEYDDVNAILEDFLNQLFPETATWGLMYHEIKWQMPVRDNLSYEERRRLIFEKRDQRAPMNPYRMEIIIGNITGRTAHIDDESGPPNTFTIELEQGTNTVNMGEAIKKLLKIKQSHTTFVFRFVSRAYLQIGAATESFRTPYVRCGTTPMISRGLGIADVGIDLAPAAQGFKRTVPMTGESGNAGQYPKTSHGSKFADVNLQADVLATGYKVDYPETSEELAAGTHPKPSAQAAYADSVIEAETSAVGYRYRSEATGTKPVISVGLVISSAETDVEASGSGIKAEYIPAGVIESGTQPKTSSKLQEAGQSLTPEVKTESYMVRHKLCGDTFEI